MDSTSPYLTERCNREYESNKIDEGEPYLENEETLVVEINSTSFEESCHFREV